MLKADRRVECWGRPAPVVEVMPGLRNVVSIRAAWNHACAVTRAGTVRCWGNLVTNSAHGENDVWSRTVRVPGLHDAIDVAIGDGTLTVGDGHGSRTGGTHYCALRSNGKVSCWGSGLWGELGNGRRHRSSIPVTVLHLRHVIQIAAAGTATCAVERDGQVWCWGGSNEGLVGSDAPRCTRHVDGVDAQTFCTATPRRIPGLSNVAEVALTGNMNEGSLYAWARTRTGEVWSWPKWSPEDEPPDVPPEDYRPKYSPIKAAGVHDVVQLASDGCVREGDGTVWCSPPEKPGEDDDDASTRRVRLQGVEHATELVSSYRLACARTAEGRTYCWDSMEDSVARMTRMPR